MPGRPQNSRSRVKMLPSNDQTTCHTIRHQLTIFTENFVENVVLQNAYSAFELLAILNLGNEDTIIKNDYERLNPFSFLWITKIIRGHRKIVLTHEEPPQSFK